MGFFTSTLAGILLILSSLSGKKVVIQGDSITVPVVVTFAEGWTSLFCTNLGAIQVNQGASGKTLESGSSCGRPVFDASTIPVKDNTYGLYILALGVNDILLNNGTFTPSGYKVAMVNALKALKNKGWSSNEILVLSPYRLDIATNLAGDCGCIAWDMNRYNAYVLAGRQAAECERCMYINVSTFYDLADLADGVHPNILGHSKFSNYLLAQTFRTQ